MKQLHLTRARALTATGFFITTAVLLLSLLPLGQAGAATPAFVQTRANEINSGTINNLAFNSANTAGNLTIAYVVWSNGGTANVTDSRGNVYASAAPATKWNNNLWSAQVFYAKNVAGGTNTVTATYGTSINSFGILYIHEYSGMDKVNPFDVTKSAIGSASAMSSGTVTTNYTNDLIFGAGSSISNVNQVGSGFTTRSTAYGNRTEDKNVTTTGSYAATASQNSSGWVMHMVAFKAAPSDTTVPSVPSGLTATPASTTQINLSWTASTDNIGVTGYKIFRNGTQIATSATTAYQNTGLTAGTTYSYTVAAYDAANNTSAQSTPVNATTLAPDTTAPSIPANLTATPISTTQIDLSWTASTDTVGVTGYKIYRNGTQVATTAFMSYQNTGLTQSTAYSYTVAAYDAANNTSAQTSPVSATTLTPPPDTSPPNAPSSLLATTFSASQINLSWAASTDNVGVTGYRIYRDGTAVATSVTTSFQDTGLTQSTTYNYSVTAYDAANNESAQSIIVPGTTFTLDTTPPSVPAGLQSSSITSNSATVSWTASTDNVGVVGYKVFRNGDQVTTTTSTSYSDTSLSSAQTYSYAIAAYDAAGNNSAQSTALQVTTSVISIGPITAPLRRTAQNSHYFIDGNNKAVVLTGSHTWNDFQDWGGNGTIQPIDFNAYVNMLTSNNQNFTFMWATEMPHFCGLPTGAVQSFDVSHMPWQRTGPGLAEDGKPKFDLTKFDQAYFDRLRSRVQQLNTAGVYAAIYAFTGEWLNLFRCNDGYPLTGINNINGINDGDGVGAITMTAPNAISALQDALVEKLVDSLNDLPNVLWATSEEAQVNSTWWNNHHIDHFHAYEATKPFQHPVGYGDMLGEDDSLMFNTNADWVAKFDRIASISNCGTGTPACKVVINDSDHSYFGIWNDSDLTVRNYVWDNLTNGSQVAFMDPWLVYYPRENRNNCLNPVNGICSAPDTRYNNLRANMGYTRTLTDRTNFIAMSPSDTLSSTGNVLANTSPTATEFIVYSDNGGPFTVNLSNTTRTLKVEWLNPSTGVKTLGANITGGSANQSFTPPFSGDAVLYIYDAALSGGDTAAPSVPASVSAAAINTTQTTISWSASTDNTAVTGYKIYRNGNQINTVNALSYTDSGLVPNTSYTYTVAAYDAVGNTSAQSQSTSATTFSSFPYPTSASSAQRKFLDQSGSPYLLKTISSWAMSQNLTNAEITSALEGAKSVGFNAVTVSPFGVNQGSDYTPYKNIAGQNFFTGAPYASSFGPAWASMDRVVQEATRLQMTVVLSIFMGYGTTGSQVDFINAGTTNDYAFGQALAARYAAYPNIVWHFEGDTLFYYNQGPSLYVEAMFHGIKDQEGSTHRLVIAEGAQGVSGGDQFISEEGPTKYQWFKQSADEVYHYSANAVERFDGVWDDFTAYPVVDIEPPYINSPYYPGNANQQYRERNYTTFIRGGSGINFGHEKWWPFGKTGIYDGGSGWLNIISEAPQQQAKFAWSLVDAYVATPSWVPDTGTFLTSGAGTGDTKAAAGYSTTTGLVYFPTSRTAAVNTTAITAGNSVRLRWYDPYTGTYTNIVDSEAKTASRSLTFPAPHSDGSSDWVLVVESIAGPADTEAPSTPANLSATAINTSQATISWSASTDNTAVTGYKINRNGSQIATVNALSYTDSNLAANTTYTYTMAAYDAVGNTSTQSQSTSTTTFAPFPYAATVNTAQRRFQDQNGNPYLVKTMSSWAIGQNLSNAEITSALEGLKALGFNAVTASPFGVNHNSTFVPYKNKAGQNYFNGIPYTSDFGPAWSTMDWIMRESTRLQMTVVLSQHLSWGTSGSTPELIAAGTTNAYNYGQALATRYASYPNIVWHIMGDFEWFYNQGPALEIDAMFHGIKNAEGTTHRLILAEPHVDNSSYKQFISEEGTSGTGYEWFRVSANTVYNYQANSTEQFDNVYVGGLGNSASYPVFDIEPPYVNSPHYPGNPNQQYRERNYATFIRGGTGINYGHEKWWPFGSTGLFDGGAGWMSILTEAPQLQAKYAWTLIDNFISNPGWVPDNGSFVVTGNDSGDTKAAAGFSPNSGLVYFPTARTAIVNTAAITAGNSVRLRWYDPVNGTYATIADSEAKTANRTLTFPATRSDGTSDWILVVESIAGPADTQAPSVPANLTSTAVSSSQINLLWDASTDNVGVTGYKVYRNGSLVGTPSTTQFQDTGLIGNTTYSYTVAAFDAANNTSPQSAASVATTLIPPPDTTPPTVSLSSPSAGAILQGTVSVAAISSDNVGVIGVQFLLNGVNLGVEDTTPAYSVTWDTTTVTNGTYTLSAQSRDAAGNVTTSAPISVTVNNSALPPGIVASYSFSENSGTTTADASGNNLTGTLVNGPTWTTGKYGNGLNFDGGNDYVNLNNPSALQLSGSMTISGWIYSTAFPVDDAAIVSKRSTSGFQLDTTIDTGPRRIGFKLTSSTGANMFRYGATTLQLNTWYHITGVYDATTKTLNVYLNGVLDNGTLMGTITTTQQNPSNNVFIGQRYSGGFNFSGKLDNIRIYGRALSQSEIQTIMNTP